jgi:1-deoxy-D-xylulose-5-phosphate reductoisomerase
MTMQNLTVLGSTGSIGVSTLDIVRRHPGRYRAFALCAHSQVDKLFEQCLEFRPRFAVLRDAALAADLQARCRAAGLDTEVAHGVEALVALAAHPESSVMAAIVAPQAGPTLARSPGRQAGDAAN